MKWLLIIGAMGAILTMGSGSTWAQIKATTLQGQAVLLYQNGTWRYADQLSMPQQATLVQRVGPGPHLKKAPRGTRPRLSLVSDTANGITDDARWFQKHGFRLPRCELPSKHAPGTCPGRLPPAHQGQALSEVTRDASGFILYYTGRNRWSDRRYLAVVDKQATRVEYLLDFEQMARIRGVKARSRWASKQVPNWAIRQGNVLYVSTGYNGYARLSRGKNAYLNAIDLRNGRVLWRSRPLVCNARNFVIQDDTIWCGYGFTAEKDYIYAIDKSSGRTLLRRKVASGPSYLFIRNNKLYVRTYDRDYVFALAR